MNELIDKLLDRCEEQPSRLDTPCLVWTGGTFTQGYGCIRWQGRMQKVHRIAYLAFVGPIEEGMLICHHCDVKACFNPNHLYQGTHADNTADAMERGQWVKPIPQPKLTEKQVSQIKFLILQGQCTLTDIGKHFGVTDCLIGFIKREVTWKSVPAAIKYDGDPVKVADTGVAGEANPNSLLALNEVMTVKRLLLNRVSIAYIARRFGVTSSAIYGIKDGSKWPLVDPLPSDAEIIFPSPEVVAARERWRRERNGSWEGKLVRRL